jgi:VCBS repeat-containing protein
MPEDGFVTVDVDGLTVTVTFYQIDSMEPVNTISFIKGGGSTNNPPIAVDDNYDTNEDETLNVIAPGVLENDNDADDDSLTAVLKTDAISGTLTLNTDGSFGYVPNSDFNGIDYFTYAANDGLVDSNIATVTITVASVNDYPEAVADGYDTNEDETLNVSAPGVLDNDTDVEGDLLTAILDTGPIRGTLTLNSDGSFEYVPNSNFYSIDYFTYTANDGLVDSNIATVTITVTSVNDVPVAMNDAYTTDEDVSLDIAAPGVLGNDTDADGDPLTASPALGPSHGTVTLNLDGSFQYTPDADFNGTDYFIYDVNDGTADSNLASVTITVDPVNDGAPVAVNDAYTTDEDVILNVVAPGVLSNDTDVDGDTLTAVLDTGPISGTLTLNLDGSFQYAPDADFNGTDTFSYVAVDGFVASNVATVTITVDPVNDGSPVAVNDDYTTDEDVTLNVVASGVLGNDTDVDGDTLTAVLDTGPISGTLTLNLDGSFQYTPNTDFYGTDTFSYVANDSFVTSNVATVTITVDPVNDAPVAVDDSYTTNQNTSLNVAVPGVLVNDTDTDGDTLTASLETNPSNGSLTLNLDGSFEYIPDAGFTGTDIFTYAANDSTVDSNFATVTINVNYVIYLPLVLK